jgi:hypothetical protein
MFKRNATLFVAGAAAFALASTAAAQNPRSTKRIPIAKEAPGEVAPPKVDTITVYKTDTLRAPVMHDTLRLTSTVTVHDTIVQNVPMMTRHYGGFYVGLGGGVGLPFGSIRTVNEVGELAQFNVGYQGLKQTFGIRVDGMWNHFSRNPSFSNLGVPFSNHVDQASVFTGNADVRANLPIFNATLGSSVRFIPYLLGGGSVIHYTDLRMKLDTHDGTVNPGGFGDQHAVFATDDNNATTTGGSTSWGFNFGGGFGFHSGRKEIFIESRGIAWNHGPSGMFDRAWNVPIAFGVNFY